MRNMITYVKGAPALNLPFNSAPVPMRHVRQISARMVGAVVRCLLVMLLVATPAMLLPSVPQETSQIVALLALCGGVITLLEYAAIYPGLVEFRNAPPFNRVRFISLFVSIALVTVIFKGMYEPTKFTDIVTLLGVTIGHIIDFPYSPVRLVMLLLPSDASPVYTDLMRSAVGLSYLISIVSLTIFALLLRMKGWPNRYEKFNFWTNLPTFDPTMGGDIVRRLNRDARFNVTLGLLLPFIMPLVVKSASGFFDTSMVNSPQTLIWMVTLWAALPLSLFMRGIALNRIAVMIDEERRRGQRAVQVALGPV